MHTLVFVFSLAIHTAAFSGNPVSHSIVGKVLDVNNLEGLTGASVRIVELDKKVYASFDGSFEMNEVPDGRYTMEVRCVSYKHMTIEAVEVKEGKIYKKIHLSPL